MLVGVAVALTASAVPLTRPGPARGDGTGDLDPAHGRNGIAFMDAGLGDEEALAVSLMPGGEVIVAGARDKLEDSGYSGARQAAFFRFGPDGAPAAGTPDRPDGGYRYLLPTASAAAPDGKLVVAMGPTGSVGELVVYRYLPSGALDSSFGRGGVAHLTTESGFAHRGNAHAVAVAPDGAVLVAGRTEDGFGRSSMAVGRLRADGSTDTGFGADGVATLGLSRDDEVAVDVFGAAVGLLPDGRVVVAGTLVDEFGPLTVISRWTPRGRRDVSFGGGSGFVVGSPAGESGEVANSAVVAPDGGTTVAGFRVDDSGLDLFVARYTPDGRRVAEGVWADPGIDSIPSGLVVDTEGRAVVVGTAFPAGGDAGTDADVFIARYLPDGSVDGSFGGRGIHAFDLGGDDLAAGVVLAGSRPVVAATTIDSEGGDVALLRFTEAGAPDPAFAGSGLVLVDVAGSADARSAMAVAPDGSVTTVGTAWLPAPRGFRRHGLVARQRPDGSADTGFRRRGVAFTTREERDDDLRGVVVLGDGSTVAVGGTNEDGKGTDPLVVRLLPDGTPDPAFGDSGEVRGTRFPGGGFTPAFDAATVTAGGAIVAVAVAEFEGQLIVARYLANGELDPSFGTGGMATAPVAYARSPWRIVPTADGGVIVAGKAAGGYGNFAVVKFTADGKHDTGYGPVAEHGDQPRFEGMAADASPDGSLVVAGFRSPPGGGDRPEFAVTRLTGSGRPDPRFDCDGFATVPVPPGASYDLDHVVVGHDGRIVAGGTYTVPGAGPYDEPGERGLFALRWLPDGIVDVSLSGDGMATAPMPAGDLHLAGIGVAGDNPVFAGSLAPAGDHQRTDGFTARFAAGGPPPAPESPTDRLARCAGVALAAGNVTGIVTAGAVAVESLVGVTPPSPPTAPSGGPAVPGIGRPVDRPPLPWRTTAGIPVAGPRPTWPARPPAAANFSTTG